MDNVQFLLLELILAIKIVNNLLIHQDQYVEYVMMDIILKIMYVLNLIHYVKQVI